MPHRITVSKPLKKRFANLIYDWDNCTRCPLHQRRQRVVHVRGRLPSTVLFIGEAPGTNEDREGFPFVGKAGNLLNKIIGDIQLRLGRTFVYSIINVVGCAPFREVPNGLHTEFKIGTPVAEEWTACRQHTDTLISMASPRACVVLGETAKKCIGTHIVGRGLQPIPVCHVYHPAYLLRQGGDNSLNYQKVVLTATEYLQSLLGSAPTT